MKILVACEYSGRVREAFRKLGHDVMSCDYEESDDNIPFHYVGDALEVIAELGHEFDLMIAHPPCTYLANSGVCRLHTDPMRWALLDEGAAFFKAMLDAPISNICVENPIMHGYAKELIGGKQQSQTIQPWMFGHPESKATCLWLKGLPNLVPTNNVKEEMKNNPDRQRLANLPPSPTRWKERSRTYQGIADAMAQQWGA